MPTPKKYYFRFLLFIIIAVGVGIVLFLQIANTTSGMEEATVVPARVTTTSLVKQEPTPTGKIVIVQKETTATMELYQVQFKLDEIVVTEPNETGATEFVSAIVTAQSTEDEATVQQFRFTEFNEPQDLFDTLTVSVANSTAESIQLSVHEQR